MRDGRVQMARDIVRPLIGIVIADVIAAVALPAVTLNMYGDPTLGILLAAVIIVASLVGWARLAFGK